MTDPAPTYFPSATGVVLWVALGVALLIAVVVVDYVTLARRTPRQRAADALKRRAGR